MERIAMTDDGERSLLKLGQEIRHKKHNKGFKMTPLGTKPKLPGRV
jgi:hypothetical protein